MMHLLKTDQKPFDEILSGRKRYELRRCEPKDVCVDGSPCEYNNGSGLCVKHVPERTFSVGDTLFLCEHRTHIECGIGPTDTTKPKGFTGRWIVVTVTTITPRGAYGLADNLCCMGIEVVNASDSGGERGFETVLERRRRLA